MLLLLLLPRLSLAFLGGALVGEHGEHRFEDRRQLFGVGMFQLEHLHLPLVRIHNIQLGHDILDRENAACGIGDDELLGRRVGHERPVLADERLDGLLEFRHVHKLHRDHELRDTSRNALGVHGGDAHRHLRQHLRWHQFDRLLILHDGDLFQHQRIADQRERPPLGDLPRAEHGDFHRDVLLLDDGFPGDFREELHNMFDVHIVEIHGNAVCRLALGWSLASGRGHDWRICRR